MPNFSRVAVAVASVIALTGCASSSSTSSDAAPAATTRSVSTAYGEVQVPTDPQDIVAVSYDTPFQLQSLGIQPSATQDYTAYLDSFTPDQQAMLTAADQVGPFGEPNLEDIAAAAPDLIVGDAYEVDEAMYDKLSRIAPTVIVAGTTRGDWRAITAELAEAVGRTDALEEAETTYRQTLARLKEEYADVIADHTWIHLSLGDSESDFSVQEPSGATGNLVVNELGLGYGPNVPPDTSDTGYTSYSLERLGAILEGVDVVLTFVNADGSQLPAIEAILETPMFQRTGAARADQVYGLATSVTDYVTANDWLLEVEEKVLSRL